MESRGIVLESDDFKRQETELFELTDRIMEEAKKRDITLRVLGAVAFRLHCPQFKYIESSLRRLLSDIDFAAYKRDDTKVDRLFIDMGYQEDIVVRSFYANRRIFHNPKYSIHSDIFFDKMEMCHDINFKGRLEIDYPTISLVDLLLEKMQIVQINEKDIIDTIMLFREHDCGNSDNEMINTGYLASLCGKDWGLWRTVTMNLAKVRKLLPQFDILKGEDIRIVGNRIDRTLESIEKEPKSLGWKMRAKIGNQKKWYRDVEERYREVKR